jgi:hypothetical protein
MKTITLDYDLYLSELEKAKDNGIQIRSDLILKLKEFLMAYDNRNPNMEDIFYQLKRTLYNESKGY